MHAEGCYLLFDCPGQVELFTLHDSLLAILAVMDKQWHLRCAPVVPRRPPLHVPHCMALTCASCFNKSLAVNATDRN